jgi:hypothetical protein
VIRSFLRSQAIFLVGGFLLAASLLPSVFSESKPDVRTSLIAGSVLALYTASFLAMGQKWSALGVVASTTLWFVLLAQGLA